MERLWVKELGKLISLCRNQQEATNLMASLLTPGEHIELARRWQIVKMLLEGEPQRAIAEKLGVSIATITRGSREIKYGDGTFKRFYDRLKGDKS